MAAENLDQFDVEKQQNNAMEFDADDNQPPANMAPLPNPNRQKSIDELNSSKSFSQVPELV